MSPLINIPMFPLSLLPLPGELVPLHIFEPRYRQLLQDAENNDIEFGIFCTNDMNKANLGSLMKLESVIKRYSGGESDIIVKCVNTFEMAQLQRTFKNKMYPGGDVVMHQTEVLMPDESLHDLFTEYLALRNITRQVAVFDLHQMANELNFDFQDRYKFLLAPKKEVFIASRLSFQIHILKQEDESRDVFHLN